MKTALIVVDAWDDYWEWDFDVTPFIRNETGAFGQFINYVCNIERNKAVDIYHDGDGYTLMPEIDRSKDITLDRIEDIPKIYDRYLFCGFHYGNCIHRRLDRLSTLMDTSKMGAVFNLSMIVPDFDLDRIRNNMLKYNTYYWTHSGYLPVNVSF